jgi:drug/metabolite transporter (DMT)-like permease
MFSGIVMVTLAAASWGTWSLFLRPTGLPATIAAPIIFAGMGLAALPFALRAPKVVWDRKTIALLLGNTACDALNILTFFAALNYTTVAIAVLSHYAAPVMIALAAPKIDGVKVRFVGPATAVALVGLAIVLEPWKTQADGAAIGASVGLLSAVFYTGNMFIVRRLAERIGAPRAMSYHSLIAAVLLLPLLFIVDAPIAREDVLLLTAGAVTIGCGSGVMFAIGLTRTGSARAAVLVFAEPLVAVLVGALVWEEALHPLAALGGAMVVGAGIVVAREAS